MTHLTRLVTRREHARRASVRSTRPVLEALEDRKLLSFSLEGGQWTYGSRITYSFMPDGTNVGGVPSNLFRKLEAAYPSSPNPDAAWQQQFQQAAAIWQVVANINLVQVPDNGEAFGAPGNQQGDPNVGDIRIGAFSGIMGSSTLAMAILPPPINGGTNAGDIFINSDQVWGTQGFDLETVALHEIGHSLGLGHSDVQTAVMYAYYHGYNHTLNTDDIAGIQSLYGAIPADPTNNWNSLNATNITPNINDSGQIALANLSITNFGDYDWYAVTVPSITTGTMVVTMQSSNLSSLSPRLAVFDSASVGLGQAMAPYSYGATVSYTVNNVQPGQVYYIRASAANSGPSGNGAYGLLVNFGSQPQAPIAPPNTVVPSQSYQGGGSSSLTSDSAGSGYPGTGGTPIANWGRNRLASLSRNGWGNGSADPSSQSKSPSGTSPFSDWVQIRFGSVLAWGEALTVAPGAGDSKQASAAMSGMGFVPSGQTSSFPIIIAPPFSDSPLGHFGAFNPTVTGSSDGTLFAIDLVLGSRSGKRHDPVHS